MYIHLGPPQARIQSARNASESWISGLGLLFFVVFVYERARVRMQQGLLS